MSPKKSLRNVYKLNKKLKKCNIQNSRLYEVWLYLTANSQIKNQQITRVTCTPKYSTVYFEYSKELWF